MKLITRLKVFLAGAGLIASLAVVQAGWLPLVAAPAGGCSQATALIARMDGAQNTAAITTLICGLVSDDSNDYALLDGLYVFATNSTGNATLNWAQNNYNLTWTNLGNCTFSANSGIKGNGTNCYADTGFTPSTASTPHYAQNSASLGGCVNASRAGYDNSMFGGASNISGTVDTQIQPWVGSLYGWSIQSSGYPTFTNPLANAQGVLIASRTGSTTSVLYQNGSSVATSADASGALIDRSFFILASNTGSASYISLDKMAYVFFGAGLSSTQASNIRTRLQTYMTTVAGSGC